MLGLGLGFIRTMFKGATGKLAGAIETTSLKNPADANTPLTIDRQITLQAGKPERVEVGYYNVGTSQVSSVTLSMGQGGKCSGETEIDISLTAIPSDPVEPGQDIGFNVILKVEAVTAKGTYICQIVAEATDTTGSILTEASQQKQFFIEVT